MTEREREDLIVDVEKAIKLTRSVRRLGTAFVLASGLGLLLLIPRVLVSALSANIMMAVWLVPAVGIVGWVYTRKHPSDQRNVAIIAHAIRSEPASITDVKRGMSSAFGVRVYVRIGGKRIELQTTQPLPLIERFKRLRSSST